MDPPGIDAKFIDFSSWKLWFFSGEFNEWYSADFSDKFEFELAGTPVAINRDRVWYVTRTPERAAWMLDLNTMTPFQREDMQKVRFYSSNLMLNDQLFALGGIDANGNPSTCCEIYDRALNQWEFIADNEEARYFASSWTAEERYIYLFGGWMTN